MGRLLRRMRRRPIRSIRVNATRVLVKLVMAIEREVRVGEEKPIREKIVAEKYIREFFWGAGLLVYVRYYCTGAN